MGIILLERYPTCRRQGRDDRYRHSLPSAFARRLARYFVRAGRQLDLT